MGYLLFLNKFDIELDKLIEKIKKYSNIENINIGKNRIELKSNNFNTKEIIKLQEVSQIIEIKTEWKKLDFKKLKKDSLDAIKENKSYVIQTEYLDKIPISAKSIYKHINPYLKHEGLILDTENYELVLYAQFRKENREIQYRIGKSEYYIWNKTNPIEVEMNNIYVAIEEPRLEEEISDFLRLCYIFKLNFMIITQDAAKTEKLVNKAKEITKGIPPEFKVRYIPHLSKDFLKVGFSKHSTTNEKDLLKFFEKNTEDRICLVFGNDTFGLTQETRDDLDYCFRLTPEVKKPLKANQALSYVLGLYMSIKIGEYSNI